MPENGRCEANFRKMAESRKFGTLKIEILKKSKSQEWDLAKQVFFL
jgi:hypothetical protein